MNSNNRSSDTLRAKPKHWLRQSLVTISCCLLASSLHAQSSVWKVSKNGKAIYLGGTLHLLAKSDYPLPGEFDLAYNRSDSVYFETDMMKLATLSRQPIPAKPDKASGKTPTLSQILKPQTLKLLKSYLNARQLSLEQFNHLSPSRLYLALSVIELTRNGLTGQGVDAHFSKRAAFDKKPQRSLETVKQHMGAVSKMVEGNADQLIANGLSDMTNVPVMVNRLKRYWRSGDRARFNQHIVLPYRQQYPTPYRTIFQERNNLWLPHIERLLASPETEFVLVGAMHLIGSDGLLQRLEKKGYRIEQL